MIRTTINGIEIHTPEEAGGGVSRRCDYCGSRRVISLILIKTESPDVSYCCARCEVEAQNFTRLAERFPGEYVGNMS